MAVTVTRTKKTPFGGVLRRAFPLLMLGLLGLAPGCSVDDFTDTLDQGAAFFGGYGYSDVLREPRQPLTAADTYTPTLQQLSQSEAKSSYRSLLLNYARDYLNTDYSQGNYIGAKQWSDGRAVMFLWHSSGLGYSAIVTSFEGDSGIVAATEPSSGHVYMIAKGMRLCFTYHHLDSEPEFSDSSWRLDFPSQFAEGLLGSSPAPAYCTQGYDKSSIGDYPEVSRAVLSRAYENLGYTHSDSIMIFRTRQEADNFISVLVAAFPGVRAL